MRSHLVIFDIDGTLTNTTGIDDKCIELALHQHLKGAMKSLDWSTFEHPTDEGILNQLLKNEPHAEHLKKHVKMSFLKALDNYQVKEPALFAAVSGTASLITTLANEGYAMALATGSWKESGLIKLRELWGQLADLPYANCDDHYARVEIARFAVLRSSAHYKTAKWQDITYVGDGLWDFETAHKLGYHFIGIDYHQDGKLQKHGAEIVFENWKNPNEFLRTLNKFEQKD